MTCINDSLSPDLLFKIFKLLDCIETTRVRRVCKDWFEIIDEHKSFWRTLHLPEESLKKWDPSILELFDQKSGSTLQDVDVRVPVKDKFQEHFFHKLKKSDKSLEHLFANFPWHKSSNFREPHFVAAFPNVQSLRVLYWYGGEVRLRRTVVQDDSKAASPLKVLWYRSDGKLLEVDMVRFQNLVSFETLDRPSSEWRSFLQGPSKTLKHLAIAFGKEGKFVQGMFPNLELPNLLVLDLYDDDRDFPRWLVVPESVKLLIRWECWNLPSVSELWMWCFNENKFELVRRCPRLKTFVLPEPKVDQNGLLEVLKRRKLNVEAGLEVDGVKMEMIEKLVLPLSLGDSTLSEATENFLEKCRELVEVVEGDAESRFIEIEV